MIIDTHCHLDQFPQQSLISECCSDNLYITMGTSTSNWDTIIQLSLLYSNIIPALGLHPWFINEDNQSELQLLKAYIEQYNITVLGEIGLDFSFKYISTKDFQLHAFEQQLMLAEQFNLPVSLHVYKAHNEVIQLLKRYSVKGVVHGFGSSIVIAREYLTLGFKLGVNGVLVRENARRYHAIVQTFGLKALVLETDAPNIRLPNREHSSLIDIYTVVNKIADLTGLPESEVIRLTNLNAQSVFNLRS